MKLKFTDMHMGSKFVCPGMCLQLSTLAQTGLMFAMIALSVDQGKHSTDHITSPWPHFIQIVDIIRGIKSFYSVVLSPCP